MIYYNLRALRDLRGLIYLIMKRSFAFFALLLLIVSVAHAAAPQKKRKSSAKPAANKPTVPSAQPGIIVRVRFTNGREVSGRLIDINLKSISIDPGNGNVVVAGLQEVASLSLNENETKVQTK